MMNLLTGSIRPLYLRYLAAAFGSSCVSCIYGIVDMAVVGQYHGPEGTAAMSVVMPIFNLIYSFGLFAGIGGSVLYSAEKGKSGPGRPNEYFTVAFWCSVGFSALLWAALFAFETPLLRLFGASDALLPLARRYMLPIKAAAPVFLFNQMLAAFLRNDDAPGLATAAVLVSGLFNVFGDVYFVFGLGLGIFGAGLATVLGACISLCVMLTHFVSRRNTLRLVRVSRAGARLREILTTGFSTFFIDLALGIVTMLFNRQIMRYLGTSALSVFGILMNLNTFVQCCAYSVGQAAQPILSMNYGARQWGRIRETLRYALCAAAAFGVLWTALVLAIPNGFVRLFMSPTAEVLAIAPTIMRRYGCAFLLIPLNVFSTYYFQSLMKPAAAFAVSVGRGLVVSGALILLLPACFGADALWFAMPATEAVVAVYVVARMRLYTRQLSQEG